MGAESSILDLALTSGWFAALSSDRFQEKIAQTQVDAVAFLVMMTEAHTCLLLSYCRIVCHETHFAKYSYVRATAK